VYFQQLRPVKFDWKERGKGDIGLIAQEVNKVLPVVVSEVDVIGKTVDIIDSETMLTVDYAKIVTVLIDAVQELSSRLKKLEGDCCGSSE